MANDAHQTTDHAAWLRENAPLGPMGRRMADAAAEIDRLRRLLRDALAREQALEARLGRQDTDAARDREYRLRALLTREAGYHAE